MSKKLPLNPFRRPEEMNLRLGRPISIRFTHKTETYLKKVAVKDNIGFSTLVSQIADDYVAWLKRERGED